MGIELKMHKLRAKNEYKVHIYVPYREQCNRIQCMYVMYNDTGHIHTYVRTYIRMYAPIMYT